MSSSRRNPRAKFWLKLAVSGGLLFLLLALLPWHEVRDAAARLRPSVWAAAFILFCAGHQLGVVKWQLLVNAGLAQLRLIDATRAYFAGLFANLFLPSIVGGDVLRATLAGKSTGRPEAAVLGGIADRVIDLATMGLFITGATLVSKEALPGSVARVSAILVALGIVGVGVFVVLAIRRPLARWPAKVRRPLGRSLVALRRLSRSPRSAVLALMASVLIQGLFILLNAWLGAEIGISVPLKVWFLAWPLAKVAGLMPISLGGIAVRDATLAALLVPFGVPLAQGVVAGLLWQTINVVGGLAGGVVWWGLGHGSVARREGPLASGAISSLGRKHG